MLSSDRQKLGYPELKIFRTNQFDKPKYQRIQVSVYIDEPKYPKLKWALDEEGWGRVGPWLTYLIWTPSTQPSLSSVYHLRLIRRILSILAVVESALTCARHIVPRCCGACEMGWWARSHNALSLPLYSHSPDSVGRNQAIVDTSLWPRGARSDVLVSTHRSTSNLLLRYFLVAPGLRSQKRIEWVKDTHRYNKSSHKMAIACIILQG